MNYSFKNNLGLITDSANDIGNALPRIFTRLAQKYSLLTKL